MQISPSSELQSSPANTNAQPDVNQDFANEHAQAMQIESDPHSTMTNASAVTVQSSDGEQNADENPGDQHPPGEQSGIDAEQPAQSAESAPSSSNQMTDEIRQILGGGFWFWFSIDLIQNFLKIGAFNYKYSIPF